MEALRKPELRRARSSGRGSRTSRYALGYAAVLAAVIVAIMPAVQLARAAEMQRFAAERALRDRMLDAAQMLTEAMFNFRGQTGASVLSPVYGGIVRPGGSRLRLDELEMRAGVELAAMTTQPDPMRGFFRFDWKGAWPPDGQIETRGALRDPGLLAAVMTALRPRPGQPSPPLDYIHFASTMLGGKEVSIVLTSERTLRGTPVTVFGVTYSRAPIERHIVQSMVAALPMLGSTFEGVNWRTATVESIPSDSGPLRRALRFTDKDFNRLLLIDVRGKSGEQIYRTEGTDTAAWETPYVGEFTLSQPIAVVVRVALPRDHGDRLVAAAASRHSHLWLMIGVTLLGFLFVAAVFVEVRRQRQLAEARRAFVSAISHELRTPLAHMAALSETLVVGGAETPEQERRWLAAIQREAHRLGRLVENVLLHTRGERARFPIEPAWVNLASVVEDIITSAEAIARARGVTVVADVPPTAEAYVDAGAVRQILLNLVDNAIKYGPERQTVTIAVQPATTPHGMLRITVDDEGCGVPEEHRERIWTAFERIDDRGGATGGSGLGLSVVRQLVRAHGGRSSVTDAYGGGARFVVELPQGQTSRH